MGLLTGAVLPFRGHTVFGNCAERVVSCAKVSSFYLFYFYGPVHPVFGYDSKMNSQQLLTHLDAMIFPTIIHAQQCSIGF